MTELSPGIIRARFQTEQSNISQYIHFIENLARIDDSEIRYTNEILERHELQPIQLRAAKRNDPYTQKQLRALSGSIRGSLPGLERRLDALDSDYDCTPSALDGIPEGYMSSAYHWVDYFKDTLSDGLTDEEMEKVVDSAYERSKWQSPDGNQSDETEEAETDDKREMREADESIDKSIMRAAIDEVERGRKWQVIHQLNGIKYTFKNLTFACRMRTHNAEIHLLRQGFILLMTAFDAAVFDLMRDALHRDFFGQIGRLTKNSKQDGIPLSRMADYGSFEAFRSRVIEDQLKRLYVKDLVGILLESNVDLIPASTGLKHVHLFELILRRNLHVHNRGLVDERYLECDQNQKPKYNLDALKLGDFAEITPEYWARTNVLCTSAIDQIAAWSDTLSVA